MNDTARTTSLYDPKDHADIQAQIRFRWMLLGIPCALLLGLVIASFSVRLEWLTSLATILLLCILIAGFDLFITPLYRYAALLKNVLYGRVREAELPFISIAEEISMVEGVACRAVSCQDVDGKGRPYDRLFYFDAAKTFPDFSEGEMLHILHHELTIVDITRA